MGVSRQGPGGGWITVLGSLNYNGSPGIWSLECWVRVWFELGERACEGLSAALGISARE